MATVMTMMAVQMVVTTTTAVVTVEVMMIVRTMTVMRVKWNIKRAF